MNLETDKWEVTQTNVSINADKNYCLKPYWSFPPIRMLVEVFLNGEAASFYV